MTDHRAQSSPRVFLHKGIKGISLASCRQRSYAAKKLVHKGTSQLLCVFGIIESPWMSVLLSLNTGNRKPEIRISTIQSRMRSSILFVSAL